ncbi:MAG TPA: hypothetical protein VHY09_11375 [Candidatus Methylacidiphilales bacterium]|jgi:hypothetical protein|nr:hypothetical protein [Candidatus Methylacidiphilales bacterium]
MNPNSPNSFRMNKYQQESSGAQPKRTIPVPRIVKPQPAASGAGEQRPKVNPAQPLKPANVMKAAHAKKYAPWLTTAKIPPRIIPKIP